MMTTSLFTGVRGIGILRSSDAVSCMDRPPKAVRMASLVPRATGVGVYVVVHKDVRKRVKPRFNRMFNAACYCGYVSYKIQTAQS
jgi:hypothetical protein